jgi:HSP20 family protein
MTSITCRPRRSAFNNDIDHWFGSLFDSPVFRGSDVDFAPSVDIENTDDHLTLTFELPGMVKDDIKVSLKDNLLTVSGRREFKTDEKSDNYIRREIRSGSFSRSFTLPELVDSGKITADYKSGLLEVRIGKLEEVKPKEVEVTVS